ncbi:hypothetical protein ACVWYF_003294 [Hymenobacter sp. UYAg731]
MQQLKLKYYNTLDFKLSELVKVFNQIKLNETASQYVNGIPVVDVETATVLRQHKYDKASTLPNFIQYQNAGIDLSVTMPDCEQTKSCLQSLTNKVDEYLGTEFGKELQFISYDIKISQFIVNQSGKAALDRAIITLSKVEESVYNAVLALHKAMMNIDSGNKWNLLSGDIINTTFDNELRIDDLVSAIKKRTTETGR